MTERRKADSILLRLLPPAFFLAVAASVFYLSATHLAEEGAASGTPITNAAMYPRLIAGLLTALTLAQVFGEFFRPQPSAKHRPLTYRQLLQIAGSVAAFVLYLIVLPVVGYHVSTPVLAAILQLLYGRRRPLPVIAYSVALSLGCALVFEGLFNVNMPRGIFGLAFSL